jgi:cell division septum initiation protein DivIVA
MADTNAPIDPDRILEQQFTMVRRGLDPLEVQRFLLQLANQIRAGRERESDLAHQLEEADKRTAPIDQLDPGQLTRLLGEETARVLEAAQSAATEIRSKAEENVARMLREARDESQQMRDDAETVLSRKTAEADEVAAGIRADAEVELEKARTEAAGLVEAGRQEGREMVAEAQKVRQRMLDDLARRRKLLRQQIDQLQAGRDRLLAAYDVVRETLDVATEELHIALPEAKLAAEATALRAGEDDIDDGGELEADLTGGSTVADDATEAAGGDDRTRAVAVVGNPDAAADAADAVEDAAEVSSDDAPDEAVDEVELVGDAAMVADQVDVELEDVEDVESVVDDAATDASAAPVVESEPDGAPDPALGTDEPDDGAAGTPEALAPDPVEGRHSSSVKVVRGGSDKAADVFARLRQQEPEAEPPAAEAEASAGPEPAAEPDAGEQTAAAVADADAPSVDDGEDDREGDALDPAAELVVRRDAATTPLEKNLARRLKRELSDEQNEVLASLAAAKGAPKADDLLPAPEDHVARYQSLSVPTLAAAATAGADLVSTIAGPAAAPTSVADLAAELAAELVAPLRERLDRAFASGSDPDDIAQSIRSSYREWKGQRVDEIAAHAVVAACNRGLLDRLPEGTLVRWVVADGDAPSPDCEDNALAGEVVRGEEFPTGHTVPPLHATCRCVVLPVELTAT